MRVPKFTFDSARKSEAEINLTRLSFKIKNMFYQLLLVKHLKANDIPGSTFKFLRKSDFLMNKI